ncbi:unnamed protein product, partial [Prorocentrum cordatum]
AQGSSFKQSASLPFIHRICAMALGQKALPRQLPLWPRRACPRPPRAPRSPRARRGTSWATTARRSSISSTATSRVHKGHLPTARRTTLATKTRPAIAEVADELGVGQMPGRDVARVSAQGGVRRAGAGAAEDAVDSEAVEVKLEVGAASGWAADVEDPCAKPTGVVEATSATRACARPKA